MPRKRPTSNSIKTAADPEAEVGHTTGENSPGDDGITETLLAALNFMVSQFAEKSLITAAESTPSISDLVRIVQLRRELVQEAPVEEIEVRWVESSEMDD